MPGARLRSQLHRDLPGVVAEAVAELYRLRSADPDQVISHSGGRDVIGVVESRPTPYHPAHRWMISRCLQAEGTRRSAF